MAKRGKSSGAGEASVPPALSASEGETVDASVASLSGLNLDQLRLQWRNQLGGIAPAHLPGWLLMRVLAYRIQAAAFGDLDRTILRRRRDDALESGDAHPFAPRGPTTREASGSSPELCWSGSGAAGWSGSWSSTTGTPGTAASTAAFRRSPRRSPVLDPVAEGHNAAHPDALPLRGGEEQAAFVRDLFRRYLPTSANV